LNSQHRSGSRIFWGLILIAAGAVWLAQALGLIPTPSGPVVGAAFAIAGLAVLASFVFFRTHWWTLIAGPTLFALGAVILLPGDLGGAIFLGGIGLGFTAVALTGVQRWWAVIPAGTMLTLTLIVLLNHVFSGAQSGAVLFAGLAATFGVLLIIPVHGREMRWPVFPAIGCLLFALMIAASGAGGELIWPLVLIAAGAVLLIWTWRRRAGPPQPRA
jgi:hypothetical protein